MRYLPCLVTLLLSLGGNAMAAERQLGAHVHGEGALDVALEGEQLMLELRLPGMDVVGFEYAPNSPRQQRAVDQAKAALQEGDTLFMPTPEAQCRLANVEVALQYAQSGDEHDHEHSDEHHSDADHDHGDEHDHEHSDEEQQAQGGQHSEFQASYQFECAEPAALTTVEVDLFQTFSSLQEIAVQVVTDAGQTGKTLTADDNRIELPR